MKNYLQVALVTAQEAGQFLLDAFEQPRTIAYKGEVDIVTEADRQSEEFIVARLRAAFPEHSVVAEEGSQQTGTSEYCWYVDPLDGTTNFAHGYRLFCVSLALVHREEILVGVVYDPLHKELFRAVQGEGAWLNDSRIQVSTAPRLNESLVATGFPTRKRHKNPNVLYYHRFTMLTHGVRRDGSAALDLCYVACGRFDGFWELQLNPWDTAAGVLLVREAGGLVTDFHGRPYHLAGEEILASNPLIHAEMQQVLAELTAQGAQKGL